jgi:hypothetical protein
MDLLHSKEAQMRWIAISIIAAAALPGATVASASGSQGDQGGPAYALVDPNGGSPRLIASHTSGFIGVRVGPFGQGDYCLTPASGVNVSTTAAVASEEAFYSDDAGFPTVRYPTSGRPAGRTSSK